ncbi:MAG: CHAT domain-containing protein [Candidatus Firestonebacteria bacterium]|nr:CHAT domain-containing protein [Candidatus Firestonebacteria bacterium]
MEIINVYIDKEIVKVDNDNGTAYQFSKIYIEKLEKQGYLEEDDLVNFGFEIFNNIFSTSLRREKINNSFEKLSNHTNLIISISSEFEEIHNIPFEIINNDGKDTGFLLKKGNISIIRDIPSLSKSVKPVQAPIRILILISLPLEIYKTSPFDPLRELDIIYSALNTYIEQGIVEIDIEEKVSIRAIKERLSKKDYHIIHFTGHGTRGGNLIIEDENDSSKEKSISADEIQDIFKGSNAQLFYFNACETAQSTEIEPSLAYHIYKFIPKA